MGVVYRATDTRTGTDVALKAPRQAAGAHERTERLRGVLREARTLVRIAHPHIVRMLGAFEHGGEPWIVMELIDGEPLSAALDHGVVFAPVEIARHGAALASALGYAHAHGVLHGDVSPGNIFIDGDGAVRLSDFGLARMAHGPSTTLEGARSPSSPVSRTFSGTLPYVAPEAIQGRLPDPRSDLFSLGAVLYEMLAGSPPFRGDTREALADAVLASDPPPFAASGRAIPESLGRVVLKALARDPASRHSTAAAFEEDLRGSFEGSAE